MRRHRLPEKRRRSGGDLISFLYVRVISKLNGEFRVYLQIGDSFLKCRMGREGRTYFKREGDHKTPRGRHKIVGCFFRNDRVRRTPCSIPMKSTRANYIWCDDEHSYSYNTFRVLPTKLRHERLWRDDQQYDFCLILDYNIMPRIRGRGSAIFFHIESAKPFTAGCLAVERLTLKKIMPRLAAQCCVII
jgi:L,D-peptidoglycan transpeptidase YkuD (ErfK/YbiS/YcfS/YnhG family)